MPERIQRKRTKGWRMPEGAIYVGRPTVFGNPFKVWPPIKGDDRFSICDWTGRTVYGLTFNQADANAYAVELYRSWLTTGSIHGLARKPMQGHWWSRAEIHRRLPELAGHDLACWCPIDQPCHADVLLEIANA